MHKPCGCENLISTRIRRLSHAMNRLFMEKARENGIDEVTMISGRIMSLLYHADRDIFQKDVEEAFHISRSSVTSVVKLMEKNGYITRVPVPSDARLKKLKLTAKGIEAHDKVLLAMRQSDGIVSSALSPDERDAFIALCDKLIGAVEENNSKDNAQ